MFVFYEAIIQNSEILKTKFSVNDRTQRKYKDRCFSMPRDFVTSGFKLQDYTAKRGGELYLNKLLVDAKNHTSFIDRSRFYREHLTYKNRAT